MPCNAGCARMARVFIPAMPYPSYTYMTDADALAIKAYLFSLPPVQRRICRTRWFSRSISAGR